MARAKKPEIEQEIEPEIPTRLSYVGIKQIGSFWYSSKDKYHKSFSTADECAKYFNEVLNDDKKQ